jgi:hypothetical protein
MTDSDGDYALYLDDVGSGTSGERDTFAYFGLGGIIVQRARETEIRTAMREFKRVWGIAREVPFHGAEIRSKKERYAWLGLLPKEKLIEFKTGIMELVASLPVVVHACIVDRAGYFKRYHARYGRNTWNMRKSAAVMVVERSAKFIRSIGGTTLSIYFEKCGGSEDAVFKRAYAELLKTGHPFDQANAAKYAPLAETELSSLLAPQPFPLTKENELVQIADLALFPVATSRNGSQNAAFDRFLSEKRLVDSLVSDETMKVKYFCFDV